MLARDGTRVSTKFFFTIHGIILDFLATRTETNCQDRQMKMPIVLETIREYLLGNRMGIAYHCIVFTSLCTITVQFYLLSKKYMT